MKQSVLIAVLFGAAQCFGAWVNATSNLAGMPSECGNLGLISAVPGKDKVIAGIAGAGLWATTDGGANWTQLGTGAGSAQIPNRPASIIYDPDNSDIFWEVGIYNGAGVFKTTDGGNTFVRLGTIDHNDGLGIDFTDPQRQTLVAGGHEQYQTIYKSINGGTSWTSIGSSFPSGTNFSSVPFVIDANTYLICCAGWGTGSTGIYRTTDGGSSWTSATGIAAAGEPLRMKNGTLYWPIQYDSGLLESTDNGVTWNRTTGNLIIKTCHPIEMPDGSMVTLARGRQVLSSNDGGRTWDSLGPQIPNVPSGITYNAVRKSFFVNLNNCGNVVLSYAVLRLDWDSGIRQAAQRTVENRARRANAAIASGRRVNLPKGFTGHADVYDMTGRNAGPAVQAGPTTIPHGSRRADGLLIFRPGSRR